MPAVGGRGPCLHCGSTKYFKRDGGLYCWGGHQVAGFVDDADNDYDPLLHTRRGVRRESAKKGGAKRGQEKVGPSKNSNDGDSLYDFVEHQRLVFMALATVMRMQLHAMITELGFPPQLEPICRDLFILTVQLHTMPNDHEARGTFNSDDPNHQSQQRKQNHQQKQKQPDTEDGASISAVNSNSTGQPGPSFADFCETYGNDPDLPSASTPNDNENDDDDDAATTVCTPSICTMTIRRDIPARCDVEALYKYPSYSNTLAVIYIGCLHLGLPIFLHDLIRLSLRGKIPYTSALNFLPPNQKEAIENLKPSRCAPWSVPKMRQLTSYVGIIARSLRMNFQVFVSPVPLRAIVFRIARRWRMGVFFYHWVVEAATALGIDWRWDHVYAATDLSSRDPEIMLLALCEFGVHAYNAYLKRLQPYFPLDEADADVDVESCTAADTAASSCEQDPAFGESQVQERNCSDLISAVGSDMSNSTPDIESVQFQSECGSRASVLTARSGASGFATPTPNLTRRLLAQERAAMKTSLGGDTLRTGYCEDEQLDAAEFERCREQPTWCQQEPDYEQASQQHPETRENLWPGEDNGDGIDKCDNVDTDDDDIDDDGDNDESDGDGDGSSNDEVENNKALNDFPTTYPSLIRFAMENSTAFIEYGAKELFQMPFAVPRQNPRDAFQPIANVLRKCLKTIPDDCADSKTKSNTRANCRTISKTPPPAAESAGSTGPGQNGTSVAANEGEMVGPQPEVCLASIGIFRILDKRWRASAEHIGRIRLDISEVSGCEWRAYNVVANRLSSLFSSMAI